MGCICSIAISLLTTLAYCTERVSTCAVCSMFLCIIMVGMIIISITGATLGYQYSQTEITELKFVRELRRREPVSLTIPPASRRRLGDKHAQDVAERRQHQPPAVPPPAPPLAPPLEYLEQKPLIGPGAVYPVFSGIPTISDMPAIPGAPVNPHIYANPPSTPTPHSRQPCHPLLWSTWYATVTPHLLRKQTNDAGHRKQLYGKAENILKKMQETNLENLLPPNIELLLKQTKNENKANPIMTEKEVLLPDDSDDENAVGRSELLEDEDM